jgi:HSP20 family protein
MMVARYPVVSNDTLRMRNALDRMFGEPVFRSLQSSVRSTGAVVAPVDVFGTETDLHVFASIPGVDPAGLDISVDDDVLSISGTVANVAKSTEAEGATWYLHEMGHGTFKRQISLPVEVDVEAAEATFENGILRLRLPKAVAAKPRQIKVQSSTATTGTPAIDEITS